MPTSTHRITNEDGVVLSTEELTILYGTAKVNGYKCNIVAKIANYTATPLDDVITCGAGNESFTITLPAVSLVGTGKVYLVKNVGSGTITVDGNGSETIDGESTVTLNQYDCVQVECNGTGWWVL